MTFKQNNIYFYGQRDHLLCDTHMLFFLYQILFFVSIIIRALSYIVHVVTEQFQDDKLLVGSLWISELINIVDDQEMIMFSSSQNVLEDSLQHCANYLVEPRGKV